MQIKINDLIDWSPLLLTFHLSTPADSRDATARLTELFSEWEKSRVARALCGCGETVQITVERQKRKGGAVGLLLKGMCPVCLDDLGAWLSHRSAEIDVMEIGDVKESVPNPKLDYRSIPRQTVQMEDGREIEVGPFEMARSPATIGLYRVFCRATGYKTFSQRQGEEESYEQNACLQALREETWDNAAASMLTLDDALAYCEWSCERIPNEAEWVAAAVIVPDVVPREDYLSTFRKLIKHRDALVFSPPEFTSTLEADGRVVLRSGPRLARASNWREPFAGNRKSVPRGYYSPSVEWHEAKQQGVSPIDVCEAWNGAPS